MNERFESKSAYRIIDANANRATEGLRTLEEIARFALENYQLTEHFKSLRHQTQHCLQQLDTTELLANRSTETDVGTAITNASETNRSNFIDIAEASAKRVQQALRCLEEFSKLVNPEAAESFKQLRYRTYDACSQMQQLLTRNSNVLDHARLYVLVDCQRPLAEFQKTLLELADAGVDLFQIRDKNCDDRRLLDYAHAAVATLANTPAKVVINDRVDIAVLSRAAAVHLGQDDLSILEARRLLAPWQWVGISTHTLDQLQQAVDSGADYVGCGPTFSSSTKQFEAFAGIAFLQAASQQTNLPAFAIGGISLENLNQVTTAGFRRVAVGHAIWNVSQPAIVAREFARVLG